MKQDDVVHNNNTDFLIFEDSVNGESVCYIRPLPFGESATEGTGERLFDEIVSSETSLNSQGVHLDPRPDGYTVRYRTAGLLHDARKLQWDEAAALIEYLKSASAMRSDVKNQPQDGTLNISIGGVSRYFDVNILPTTTGESVVMTLRKNEGDIPTLEQLGVWGESRQMLLSMLSRLDGLTLITGSDRHLLGLASYSVISPLNHKTINIAAVESSAKFVLPGVSHIKASATGGSDVAEKISLATRQDVDVLLVEETRDSSVAEALVQVSSGKRSVISTIYAKDGKEAVIQLLRMGVEPYMLASVLRCLLEMHVVRRICSSCRISYEPTTHESEEILKKRGFTKAQKNLSKIEELENEALMNKIGIDLPLSFDGKKIKTLYKRNSKGCSKCLGRGVLGKTSISTVTVIDDKYMAAIAAGTKSALQKIPIDNAKTGALILALRGVIDADQL